MGEAIYRFGYRTVAVISLLLTGVLFLCALFTTAYAENMDSQLALLRSSNPLPGILAIFVFLIANGFLSHFLFPENKSLQSSGMIIAILQAIVSVWMLAAGLYLCLKGGTGPAADAASVYGIALQFADGNYSSLVGADSYLSYYPFQLGLAFVWAVYLRIHNLLRLSSPAYVELKCIYVVLLPVILHCLRICLQRITKSNRAVVIFLLLMGGNLPLIMYSQFLYGEIPSLASFSIGAAIVSKILNPEKRRYAYRIVTILSAVFFFSLAVLMRKNTLIPIVALLIVLVFTWLQSHKHDLLILAALTLAGCLLLPAGVQSYCEGKAGYELAGGVRSLSYLAMGMQESSRGSGWYNGYNFQTYMDAGLDDKLADTISREDISNRLAYFKANPSEARAFYYEKFATQWLDGTYACRQATLVALYARSEFLTGIYEGRRTGAFLAFCDIWQSLLYLGCFAFAISRMLYSKKKITENMTALFSFLFPIAAIGGFLFHMAWEANSRYIFTYAMLLVPNAAAGLDEMMNIIKFRRKNQ